MTTSFLTAPRAAIGSSVMAAGLTVVVFAAPAAAGPAQPGPLGPGNAQIVIAELKSRGDQIIINRNGPARPLANCIATSVRVGRHIYKQVPQRKGVPIRTLASHVMYVTVEC